MSEGDLAPGASFGPFRIDQLLRRTTAGADYRATQVELGTTSRLRVLPRSSSDPEQVERLRAQLPALRLLRHPAIRVVQAVVVDGSRVALELPDTAGRPLAELIDERGALPAAAHIPRPIADALDHGHNRGVLHRNLTPDAVLVDEDAGRTTLTFGVALPPAVDVVSTMPGGDEVDFPLYQSPEQSAGDKVSHRSDLYSFGCLAFALLTGTPPFTRPSQLAVALAHAGEPVPRASERNPALPTGVDAVFDRALAKPPTHRYPSAGDLVDDLRAALPADPVSRRPESAASTRPPARTGPPAGRSGPWWPAVAVAVVLAVAGTVYVVTRAAEPPAPAATAQLVGQPVPVGAEPSDVEVGEGFVWTSNDRAGSISKIDPETGSSQQIPVGGAPAQLVVGEGAIFVRTHPNGFTRVDPATGAVSAPVIGPSPVNGMAVGAGSLWLSHAADGTVTRHDARSLAQQGEPIKVGVKPRAMAFGARLLYVLNTGDSTMVRIDPATGSVVGPPTFLPEGVGGLEVEDGVVYVAAGGKVVPVPEDSAMVGEPFLVEGFSYFELAGPVMWVVYDEENVVRRLDVATRTFRGQPLPGVGADIGRARFGFGELWLTVPSANQVIRMTATTP